MSYNFDGKIAAQGFPKIYQHEDETFKAPFNGMCKCERCGKFMFQPKSGALTLELNGGARLCQHYIGTDHFIYETKSGTPVVYCSEYCRNKHNHRFSK